MKKSQNLKINTNPEYKDTKFKSLVKTETHSGLRFKNLNYLNNGNAFLLSPTMKNLVPTSSNKVEGKESTNIVRPPGSIINNINKQRIKSAIDKEGENKSKRLQLSPQAVSRKSLMNRSTMNIPVPKTPNNKVKTLSKVTSPVNLNSKKSIIREPYSFSSNKKNSSKTIINSRGQTNTSNLTENLSQNINKNIQNINQIINQSQQNKLGRINSEAKFRPHNPSNLSSSTNSSITLKEHDSQNTTDCSEPKLEAISVSALINNQNIPLSFSNLSVYFPFYESSKFSSKPLGAIQAYAANTYQGVIRNYNEDRVSIILNIAKPNGYKGKWPKCSFFGIYDGHGGHTCADFLRDQLHSFVIRDSLFPRQPVEALKRGFQKAEEEFLTLALKRGEGAIDKSGSCAVVCLVIDETCYIANVGDSRAVMSSDNGKTVTVLTNDHKPNEEGENKRIFENGGKVYQTQTPTRLINMPLCNSNEPISIESSINIHRQCSNYNNLSANNSTVNNCPLQILIGPYRVFPGRLSVSRTFGDVEAKIPKLGGLRGVVIASPEISVVKITPDSDFIVLGCDGIFDQLSNKDTVDCVWMTVKDQPRNAEIHSQCALAVDMIMKSSLVRRTLDNITVLMIAFENFENKVTSVGKKTENFSPKSSYILYNAIENKDVGDYYCQTEPDKNENKSESFQRMKSFSPSATKSGHKNNFMLNSSDLSAKNKSKNVLGNGLERKYVLSPKNKKTNTSSNCNLPSRGGYNIGNGKRKHQGKGNVF